MIVFLLCLACTVLVSYVGRLIALDGHTSSRAPLPRHAGQTRRCAPVAAPDEGPAGPGGIAPETSPVPGAEPFPRNVRYPALNPVLYVTDALPRLCTETEDWWDQ